MTQPFGKTFIAARQLKVPRCKFYLDKKGFGPCVCGINRSLINKRGAVEFRLFTHTFASSLPDVSKQFISCVPILSMIVVKKLC